MSTKTAVSSIATAAPPSEPTMVGQVHTELTDWFGQEVDLWDCESQTCLKRSLGVAEAICESSPELPLLFAHRTVEFIAEEGPILIMAVPLYHLSGRRWLAVLPIATMPWDDSFDRHAIAELLGIDAEEVESQLRQLPPWPPEAAQRMAMAYQAKAATDQRNIVLNEQLEASCDRLASTFEEITLFHRLTQNLTVSRTDEELGLQASEWALEYLSAVGCALRLLAPPHADKATYETRSRPVMFATGQVPFSDEEISELAEQAELVFGCGPSLLTADDSELIRSRDGVRELLFCPICDRSNLYGYLILVNSDDLPEFGPKDRNMVSSVCSILGTHCGNYELYRQQNEFLASVVRALTSAIDAKDCYTCGHSDRVARMAVRLARELKCSDEELSTIYMAGLLHDIGKIGINDAVLSKPGRLTPEEIAHIRQHPQLGFNILADLDQLEDVLPVVLHHHEEWSGNGYPAGLSETEIPLLARITSVADAFDAMTSSRSYRDGLPVEQVLDILRAGSGEQWDPTVVDTFFSVLDDILEISHSEREGLTLDVQRWTR